ncbi:ABC transporter ATP-binding protein [Corynebacterium mendelii]|uniref:ABC transporter ATP-binding protein n=1 Tax=Corynebacterium mendelii TaxID=2765362 RepID=A0A939E267_9CORY|nr:ABC transporter ATP-binding protein [Corynebacterium mendelii]MBN9645131.1 ABC transporter ATP-binding protein [Corynebacterium mendelii]
MTAEPAPGIGVTVDHLVFRAGAVTIIDDVCLTVAPGSLTGLIGPNGSGKSTLLKLILGLAAPAAGSVTIGGKDLRRWSRRELARTVAVLAQHSTASTDMTASQVVNLGRIPHQSGWALPSSSDRDMAQQLLDEVGVGHLADRHWSLLSGGERQKVQLARALAQKPRALVLDEPTNHLDPAAAWDLMEQVAAKKLTTIAAIHDLDIAARFCDRLVVLSRGTVVAHGSPREVLTTDMLAEVYGLKADIGVHPVDGGPLVIHTGVSPLAGQR